MTSVAQIFSALHQAARSRAYITRLDLLTAGQSILKARLHLKSDLFVQVYRNDEYDTTNLVLINSDQRVYGRDEVAGTWHRHPSHNPSMHDKSEEGRRAVTLEEFLNEVEHIVIDLNLL